MYKKSIITFALATIVLIIFIEADYNQHKFYSKLKLKELKKN